MRYTYHNNDSSFKSFRIIYSLSFCSFIPSGDYDLSNTLFTQAETTFFSANAGHRPGAKKVIIAITDIQLENLNTSIKNATSFYNTKVKQFLCIICDKPNLTYWLSYFENITRVA